MNILLSQNNAYPHSLINVIWKHRQLIANLVKRELEARYRGSLLGILWYILVPFLMLMMYTFVFTKIFPARWGVEGGGTVEFALLFFVGLIFFTIFMECINRSADLMLENQNYIKKVVFPLEVLPWVILIVSVLNALVSICVLMGMYFVVLGKPPLTALLLPVVAIPLLLLTLGLAFLVSSLGVFIRDMRQIVALLSTFLLFLSPIFYPVSAVPSELLPYIYLNPLTIILEQARGVLFWGELPNWREFIKTLLINGFIAWFGYAWFMLTKKAFADVV